MRSVELEKVGVCVAESRATVLIRTVPLMIGLPVAVRSVTSIPPIATLPSHADRALPKHTGFA
eukprot:2643603-Rhodomonas_salina.2